LLGYYYLKELFERVFKKSFKKYLNNLKSFFDVIWLKVDEVGYLNGFKG
jgi:YesN/AraC family two-component response regulator